MSDNVGQLLEIERQGAEFVRALIPLLPSTSTGNSAGSTLWQQTSLWRGHCFIQYERIAPDGWRKAALTGLGWTRDYAFFAGAESAIQEYEATT
jgi:hypothetical protein